MHREHLRLVQEALRHDLPTILSGEEIRRLCSGLEADARALWALRVLSASAKNHAAALHIPGDDAPDLMLIPLEDAARLSAAVAVYPDLPEAVRREIGECH